jgi:hypothetical protein
MDLVGYSKLLLDEQRQYMEQLTESVRGSGPRAKQKPIRLPWRWMALVFDSPEAPARAMEISKKLKEYPQLKRE